MEQIKRLFGVLMLLVAVWLLDRTVSDSITLGLYGIIIAVYGIYLGAFESLKENQPRIQRAIAIVLALYGAIMLVGASGGGTDPLQPLNSSNEQQDESVSSAAASWDGQLITGEWFTVYGESSLQAALDAAKQANKTVLVDFFAEWCVACIVLEEETLTKPNVLEAMADVVLIRADVTDINAENRKIMERFDILGLPCLIFFNIDGNEIPNSRILGEMGPDTFLEHFNSL